MIEIIKNVFKKNFFSTKITALLFILIAIIMAIGTLVEKKYSTDIAKIYIYKSHWFEIIIFLFIINLIINIWKYKLWKYDKIPIFIFHLSFIFIFIGGIFSRYLSFEGIMFLKEGNVNRQVISETSYIKLKIKNQVNDLITEYKVPYILSTFHHTYNGNFLYNNNNIFNLKIINYIPYAKETFYENNLGEKIIKIISYKKGKKTDFFLKNGKSININGILFSLNKHNPYGIQIFEKNNKLFVKSSFLAININMMHKKLNFILKNKITPLQLKSLYQIYDKKNHFNNIQWMIPDKIKKGKIMYVTAIENPTDYLDAITAKITFVNTSKIVTFLGGKQTHQMSSAIKFNGKYIYIGYGSIFITLPFILKLNKFKIENYPGSDFPSTFISNITLLDHQHKQHYDIYMNHILNYKGYKFFQSGYDSDKKGTHLYVNHDYLGTLFSYIGYFIMSIGMIITLFWKGSRFNFLIRKLQTLSKI
ncbi:cytochrome c biogenesis protein ResB [Blattabacterium cuenoti]|uniref:cytochrome c biogenesis protein ResB n=1 Tax=Blattabacterium cuenoti TaxID=1653831 RepID=UPI001EE9EAFF|nr:cytochrome c biogenesis protein ResB [Blattabacterium cuenoti]